jgi:thiamine pyrophosphate-dependent acetolactate synthase large subunit-like protein
MAAAAGTAVAVAAVVLAAVAAGAVILADVAAFLTGVLGTTLRAIGRGFGNGTFGLAEASAAHADNPTASARLVAKAVDRNAAARVDRVTAFLGGESFNRSSLRSI